MTRRSKYYVADKSWTKRSAWAFEVPLDTVRGGAEVIVLRYETGPATGQYGELNVTCTFLLDILSGLRVREDRQTLSLFLSPDPQDLFIDKRGSGGVCFKQFAGVKDRNASARTRVDIHVGLSNNEGYVDALSE